MINRKLEPAEIVPLEPKIEKMKKKKVKLQLRAPTQERSRQTVSTILEACAKIIVSEGYFGVTTDKIAKDAGVSIGSIYQFFGNKESVISAVIVDLFEKDAAFFMTRLKDMDQLTPEQKIDRLFEAALDVYSTEIELRSRIQNIYHYLVDPKYYAKLTENYVSVFKQFIPEINGRNSHTQARLAVHGFIGLMENIVLENPDFRNDKSLTDEIMRFFTGYLKNKW